MNKPKAVIAMVSIAFIIAIGAMAGTVANAANPPVGLGTAASYSVLAEGFHSIRNTGDTTLKFLMCFAGTGVQMENRA